jgi:hypothetical protein
MRITMFFLALAALIAGVSGYANAETPRTIAKSDTASLSAKPDIGRRQFM